MRPCIAAAALCAACVTGTAPELGDEFDLTVGESARLVRPGITVTFVEVAQDSRCPRQVQCVWAGDAAVVLQIEAGGTTRQDTLHTHEGPRTAPIDGLTVELLALAPYPETPGDIAPGDYVVTLTVRAEP